MGSRPQITLDTIFLATAVVAVECVSFKMWGVKGVIGAAVGLYILAYWEPKGSGLPQVVLGVILLIFFMPQSWTRTGSPGFLEPQGIEDILPYHFARVAPLIAPTGLALVLRGILRIYDLW